MTIKWVKVDPLVMNGEPFLYGSRLTVRQLLEMRANGLAPADIIKDHPELRVMGIASAFVYAAEHPDRYGEFLEGTMRSRAPASPRRTSPRSPSRSAAPASSSRRPSRPDADPDAPGPDGVGG